MDRTARSAAQKKSLHAAERDTEVNRQRREEFHRTILTLAPEQMVFLDESGVTVNMTRSWGRCVGGGRIHEGTPESRWQVMTLLGAMSLDGMIATMAIEAATDGDIFLAYLDEVLCPRLKRGQVVIMDNLSAHKVAGVRERIEQAGARVLYLPPYSPDLNPIEKAWSKLKHLLRSAKARTADALLEALRNALPQLTPENAKAWFRTCLGWVHL